MTETILTPTVAMMEQYASEQKRQGENLRVKFICDYLDFAEEILILHGTEDEIVPFEAAREFCEEQLIEFIPVEGADHRFRSQKAMDQAIKLILDFIQG